MQDASGVINREKSWHSHPIASSFAAYLIPIAQLAACKQNGFKNTTDDKIQ
ncbi:unnamed protein product [Tenebrio molitor]|nr:unnamed protein product [Tenebrio molitor]